MLGHVADLPQTLTALGLWSAFFLGLTGGLGHCLTMCGPLVAAVGVAEGAAERPTGSGGGARARAALRFQATYHAGRLLTYALIGGVLGLLGEAGSIDALRGPLSPVALTRWLKLGAGVTTGVIGLVLVASWLRGRGARLPEPTAWLSSRPWFRNAASRLLQKRDGGGFALGMLMGLLPCAPLLPAEVAALGTGEPMFGASVMLAFGLGTLPALIGVGAATGTLARTARTWAVPVAGASAVVLGLVVAAQGLRALGT